MTFGMIGWRRLVAGGMIFGALLVLGWLASYYIENPRATYASIHDVECASATDRQWLLSFLPASAVAITHMHNVDTNAAWTRFNVPAPVADSLMHTLTPLGLEEARRGSVQAPWLFRGWPPELHSRMLITPRASFRTFRSPNRGACLAVDAPTRAVFVWSCVAAS